MQPTDRFFYTVIGCIFDYSFLVSKKELPTEVATVQNTESCFLSLSENRSQASGFFFSQAQTTGVNHQKFTLSR